MAIETIYLDRTRNFCEHTTNLRFEWVVRP